MGVVSQCYLDVTSLFYGFAAVFLAAIADAVSWHWERMWVKYVVYFVTRSASVALLALAVNHRGHTADIFLCILFGVTTFYVMSSRLFPGWHKGGFMKLGTHWIPVGFAAGMIGAGTTFAVLFSRDERREPYVTVEMVAVALVSFSDLVHFVLQDPDKPTVKSLVAASVNTMALGLLPWAIAQHCEV